MYFHIMNHRVTKVHPDDNVLVALANLEAGETVSFTGSAYTLPERVPAKRKFVTASLQPGDEVKMYGVLVGRAVKPIPTGGVVTTANLKHASSDYTVGGRKVQWTAPDVSRFRTKTFMGF